MRTYSLSHVPDATLLRDLAALVARDRATTAAMLAHLAEVDARRLYLPAAYPSMYAYCVGELRLPEDAAYKRIQAARAGREFPALFTAVADGRLHLTAVGLLAPHLTAGNANELIGAAARKSKAEIEQLLAQRFPRSEVLPLVMGLAPAAHGPDGQLAPAQVGVSASGRIEAAKQPAPEPKAQPAPGQVGLPAPERVGAPGPRPRVTPLAPQRFALQVTIGQETHDKLRHAQALLGHQIPAGEIAQVLDRALDALISQLERRKLAATRRARRRPSENRRHVPAEVKRRVWQRDGGQCTFVSAAGRRCSARTRLEFDHVEPVARGGQATVSGIRLRCQAHNQYAAECAFGAGFMREKREAAERSAPKTRSEEAASRTRPGSAP